MMLSENQQQMFDDIELRVFKNLEGDYTSEISLCDGSMASSRLPSPPLDSLNLEKDPRAYGIRLFEWSFQGEVLDAFRRARWSSWMYSKSAGPVIGLRLRVWLDQQATELHRLQWEALRDPGRDEPLTLEMAFSRYLRVSTARGRPISERPLRMLLLFSNPDDLSRVGLAGLDASSENTIIDTVARSQDKYLSLERRSGSLTLQSVLEQVKKGFHIIHIVAHVSATGGRGYLILADDTGGAQPVPFEEITAILAEASKQAPNIVFLSTPVMTREPVGETLMSLAPMLMKTGVMAFVTLQSPIDDAQMVLFIERFYTVLIRSGVIDMAMSEARNRIYASDHWEWTSPVLFTCTPDPRLFYPLPESLEGIVVGVRLDKL